MYINFNPRQWKFTSLLLKWYFCDLINSLKDKKNLFWKSIFWNDQIDQIHFKLMDWFSKCVCFSHHAMIYDYAEQMWQIERQFVLLTFFPLFSFILFHFFPFIPFWNALWIHAELGGKRVLKIVEPLHVVRNAKMNPKNYSIGLHVFSKWKWINVWII